MKKKKLYRFDVNHRLDEHKLTEQCKPEKCFTGVTKCSHGAFPTEHLFYGYLTKKEAAKEEVTRIKYQIKVLKSTAATIKKIYL